MPVTASIRQIARTTKESFVTPSLPNDVVEVDGLSHSGIGRIVARPPEGADDRIQAPLAEIDAVLLPLGGEAAAVGRGERVRNTVGIDAERLRAWEELAAKVEV